MITSSTLAGHSSDSSHVHAPKAAINKVYKPLYTSKKRYFFITGGRGSLKSTTVHDFIARLTYERGHGILFTRYTLTSAELSIIPEFSITLNRLGIIDDFNVTKHSIINKRTGSFIYFSGIKAGSKDQTARLKGIPGITTWVIDEGEDFKDEKAFDAIDDTIRTTTHQNRIIWIQNPTTKEHFIYKRWMEKTNQKIKVSDGVMNFDVTVSTHPAVEHIHTTFAIAEKMNFLVDSWIEKKEGKRNDVIAVIERTVNQWTKSETELDAKINMIWHTSYYYYNYIGGWLERAEGCIFENWIEGEFDDTLSHCYGQDYGYSPDPLANVKVAVDSAKKRIYVKEMIYETMIDDIPAWYKMVGIGKNELIVTDTNEPRTTATIQGLGYNIVHAVKLQGSIAEDIREIKQYTIIVDPKSTNVKIELNNYVWNDEKASIPIDAYNHAMDGMRYGFNRLVFGTKTGVRRTN